MFLYIVDRFVQTFKLIKCKGRGRISFWISEGSFSSSVRIVNGITSVKTVIRSKIDDICTLRRSWTREFYLFIVWFKWCVVINWNWIWCNNNFSIKVRICVLYISNVFLKKIIFWSCCLKNLILNLPGIIKSQFFISFNNKTVFGGNSCNYTINTITEVIG